MGDVAGGHCSGSGLLAAPHCSSGSGDLTAIKTRLGPRFRRERPLLLRIIITLVPSSQTKPTPSKSSAAIVRAEKLPDSRVVPRVSRWCSGSARLRRGPSRAGCRSNEPMGKPPRRRVGAHGSWGGSPRPSSKSLLGTVLAPLLPLFLRNNPLPNGRPWSLMNTTNYYREHPHTGVIRPYDFAVSRGVIAPDGYQREALLVNGAFPGPPIEANWGDTIQVTVRNNVTDMPEGVSLHWHGFLQKGKPWEDGVPAVTQCPIAPGESFTYSFEAELYGTLWYHSHYSSQFSGGLLGPIVVYGPHERPYDVDIGPVLISDWYHRSYYDLVKETMRPNGTLFRSNNTLINGKGNLDCALLPPGDGTPCVSNAGLAKFRFRRGKTHRLRLVNTGAEVLQRFSIDGHTMTVVANDFVAVEPYETSVVTLGIGQRTDVLVRANGTLDAYWMRSNVSEPCSLSLQPHGLAAVYYDGADEARPALAALGRARPRHLRQRRPAPHAARHEAAPARARPHLRVRGPGRQERERYQPVVL